MIKCSCRSEFQNFLDNQFPQEVFLARESSGSTDANADVFHLAGKRFSIDDTDWTSDRKNQFVLIGR